MHFCGNFWHDIWFIPIYLLLLIPGVKIAYSWLKAKLDKKKVATDCCDCHHE